MVPEQECRPGVHHLTEGAALLADSGQSGPSPNLFPPPYQRFFQDDIMCLLLWIVGYILMFLFLFLLTPDKQGYCTSSVGGTQPAGHPARRVVSTNS